MAGYQKGMLNNDMQKLSDDCFGTLQVQEDMQFAYMFMSRQRPITDVVKFTQKMVGIINSSMDDCGYTNSIKMLQDFCRKHYTPAGMMLTENSDDKLRCGQSTLIRNFYTRIFNFLSSYMRIDALLAELMAQTFLDVDGPTIYLTMLGIGREIGNDLRILFEFLPPDDFEYNIDPWMLD